MDFLSIGTNDLTQYALAAERGNPQLAALADPLDPGVLALVESVCRAAAGGPLVAVCGELAADERAARLLVGMGVRRAERGAAGRAGGQGRRPPDRPPPTTPTWSNGPSPPPPPPPSAPSSGSTGPADEDRVAGAFGGGEGGRVSTAQDPAVEHDGYFPPGSVTRRSSATRPR